jgi:hypothetical protein
MSLILWGMSSAAQAAPSCQEVDPLVAEACYCVFESVAADWMAPNALDPTGTCFEFNRIVNAVPADRRVAVLNRMDTVADNMACGSDRRFLWFQNLLPSGAVWITGQLLETMADDDCGIGQSIPEMREEWTGDTWLYPEM